MLARRIAVFVGMFILAVGTGCGSETRYYAGSNPRPIKGKEGSFLTTYIIAEVQDYDTREVLHAGPRSRVPLKIEGKWDDEENLALIREVVRVFAAHYHCSISNWEAVQEGDELAYLWITHGPLNEAADESPAAIQLDPD